MAGVGAYAEVEMNSKRRTFWLASVEVCGTQDGRNRCSKVLCWLV